MASIRSASVDSALVARRVLALACGLAFLGLAPAACRADVTFSGSVSPDPPTNGGNQSGTLVVGDRDDSNSNSPIGFLTVDDGTTLQYDRLLIGDEDDVIGDVLVTGAGSRLTLDGTTTSNDPALEVAEEGTAYLTIQDGGVVDVSDTSTSSGSNGTMRVGQQASGFGYVTVEGRLSQLVVGDNMIIGQEGYGQLTVADGALAYYSDPDDGTFVLGEAATGVGLATVDGATTFLQLPQTVTIGTVGVGTLRVTGGATADAANGFGGSFTVGVNGLVEVGGGGRLLTDALTLDGRAGGDGSIVGPVTISTTGELTAGPDETLRMTGAVTNEGLVNVAGAEGARAEIEFVGALSNDDPGGSALPGRITVGDGTVRFNSPLTNDGTLASTSGVTDFHGEITNGGSGLIAIGGQSNATFYDTVDVTSGTLNIAAGSTALFLGDITISPGVTLAISLDESAAEPDFGTPLQAAGVLTLDTPVTLSLADGFVPSLGDAFPLVEAAGGLLVGVVDPNNFEPLPDGLDWSLQLSNDGLTAVVVDGGIDPGDVLDGDYNSDGVVDAADYAVWRDSLGQSTPGLPADGNGDGTIDSADYDIWRQNFGATASGSTGQIPEPGAGCLVLAALMSIVATGRRK